MQLLSPAGKGKLLTSGNSTDSCEYADAGKCRKTDISQTNELASRVHSCEICVRWNARNLGRDVLRQRRDGRVAEGAGLLNRYTVKSRIGGSNPPLSAISAIIHNRVVNNPPLFIPRA